MIIYAQWRYFVQWNRLFWLIFSDEEDNTEICEESVQVYMLVMLTKLIAETMEHLLNGVGNIRPVASQTNWCYEYGLPLTFLVF